MDTIDRKMAAPGATWRVISRCEERIGGGAGVDGDILTLALNKIRRMNVRR